MAIRVQNRSKRVENWLKTCVFVRFKVLILWILFFALLFFAAYLSAGQREASTVYNKTQYVKIEFLNGSGAW